MYHLLDMFSPYGCTHGIEMLYNNKLVIISVIYCSPSQSSQKFAKFEMLFRQLLNDITLEKTLLLNYPW